MAQLQLSRFGRKDKVLVGAAVVVLLTLFAPWYQASVAGYTIQSVSGWGSGYGLLGALCLVLAAVYVVLQRSDVGLPRLPIGARLTVLSLSALGTLIILVRIGTLPHGNAGGGLVSFHYGPAFGLVLALLAGVVETIAATMILRAGPGAAPEPSMGEGGASQ
jgi:hypothetical protein